LVTSRTGKVLEVSARVRIGASAGLTALYTGGYGSAAGSVPRAALIAACTSCSALAMSRLWVNCRMITDSPCELLELIMVRPEICPNWRSSGVVTRRAMVEGLAPGYCVVTCKLGASTLGSAATGRVR